MPLLRLLTYIYFPDSPTEEINLSVLQRKNTANLLLLPLEGFIPSRKVIIRRPVGMWSCRFI